MQKELDARALQSRSILASKGDLVLWHADVLHGAEPIGDEALTRRSLVAHYFSLEESRRRGDRLARAGRGL
jgi:phytanoyl-CoA hydroxylase